MGMPKICPANGCSCKEAATVVDAEGQHSRKFGELAFHIGDHHVLDFEFSDAERRQAMCYKHIDCAVCEGLRTG